MSSTGKNRMEGAMKVFISVDMEGIACVTHPDHVKQEGGAYEAARRWATGEANAAIDGALEGGATEIVVSDGHGKMHNLIADDLHEDVKLVQGIPRSLLMMEGLERGFDAVFFIGYHARAGNPSGTLAHSFSGQLVREVRLNQEPVSEALFNAAVAGHFDVPVALIAGDSELAGEIEDKLPWVERVVTKWSLSGTSARNLTPKASQNAIRSASKKALKDIKSKQVYQLSTPIAFEVDFRHPMYAYVTSAVPGMETMTSTSVRYSAADMIEVTKIWRLMLNACSGNTLI
jgi:D-amino peptidase